jgi:murein tripeptide amidase MpaA
MYIHSNFDGGNISVAINSDLVLLNIEKDNNSGFFQWFYFRASNLSKKTYLFCIQNAGESSYPKGWEDYSVRVSENGENWFCCPTNFVDGKLHFSYAATTNTAWFAYFAPYPLERHQKILGAAQEGGATSICLGNTLDGYPIDLLKLGTGERKIWIIARQHPGETMAQWWMEGLIARLISEDSLSKSLLTKATFFLVPNMNPDGSFRGNIRTNSSGANLNREWSDSTMQRSPEVFLVRKAMLEVGVDLCLDVHGDEAIPHNFIAGMEGIPSLTQRLIDLQESYEHNLMKVCPDFQREFGYEKNKPGTANLGMCTNYVAETFDCLAVTIEQPFKDVAYATNPQTGWSPERAKSFGASNLDAIAAVIDDLR